MPPGTPGASNPRSNWVKWLLQAGRGFGKTRCGAETIRLWASQKLDAPIHLIAPTAGDIRKVMVEGPSGLLKCYPPGSAPHYEPSKGHLLTWPNGNIAYCFSADEPERLRGPQCGHFWADELAAWRYSDEAWDNLMFGFRLGNDLRGVITSTPRPIPLVKRILSDSDTVVTRGSTYDNRQNLAEGFFRSVIRKYEGTRLGRQELLGELLEDIPGALWTMAMIDQARCDLAAVPPLVRVVIAIDPAVTAHEESDETGLGAAGIDHRGHVYVLEDKSLRTSPQKWAVESCKLFIKWSADRIVAEVNNGGDLVEGALRQIHPQIPFRAVRASRGKAVRAEPVAAMYERGMVHHVSLDCPECERDPRCRCRNCQMKGLEEQLCAFVPGVTDKSPDRLDWLVWAITDLVISPADAGVVSVRSDYRISPY